MEDIKKRNARQNAWNKDNSKKISFRFMYKADADILEALEKVDNKAGFVKQAIRKYIAEKNEE